MTTGTNAYLLLLTIVMCHKWAIHRLNENLNRAFDKNPAVLLSDKTTRQSLTLLIYENQVPSANASFVLICFCTR